MAKRFTDSGKWKHPSFRKLPLEAKLTWIYLLDNVDHAGIWLEDYELATFQLGFDLSRQLLALWFGDKLHLVDGKRLLLPGFLEFQYGKTLDKGSRSHISARKILDEFDIDLDALPPSLASSIDGAYMLDDRRSPPVTNTNTDTNTDTNTKKGGVGENKPAAQRFDFEALYSRYPRKEGKGEGMRKCKAQIKSEDDYQKLAIAIERYREAKIGVKADYLLHFSSFMTNWRDWLDPRTGTADVTIAPAIKPRDLFADIPDFKGGAS